MKYIELTQGYKAKVNDEDWPKLSKHKWYAQLAKHTVYARRNGPGAVENRDIILMQNAVFGSVPSGFVVDHKDRNGLNNQRENLRLASRSQNGINKGPNKEKAIKYKGVSITCAKNYMARIQCEGKNIYLGRFDTPEKAALAYDAKARELFGEFAYLNFPDNTCRPELTAFIGPDVRPFTWPKRKRIIKSQSSFQPKLPLEVDVETATKMFDFEGRTILISVLPAYVSVGLPAPASFDLKILKEFILYSTSSTLNPKTVANEKLEGGNLAGADRPAPDEPDDDFFAELEEIRPKLMLVKPTTLEDYPELAAIDDAFKNARQPSLLSAKIPKALKRRRRTGPKLSETMRQRMYALCYGAETVQEALTLTSAQRGRVSGVLGKLLEAKADLKRLADFKRFWDNSWWSKSKGTGQYVRPTPNQVLENWNAAMKAIKPDKPDSGTIISSGKVISMMQARSRERREGGPIGEER